MFPLISIVMPLLNQERFLPEALKSVLDQSYKNLELLVVDGGSTDGSLEILNEYSSRDSRLKWFSGKDSGPAQAVNRAVRASFGEIIGWLNADDLYAPDAIRSAVEALSSSSESLMIYGHGDWINEKSEKLGSYPTKAPLTPIEEFQNGCFICQPTVFLKRSLWTELGGLDESLEASFDFDLWIRVFKKYSQGIVFLDKPLACSRIHGNTITQNKRHVVAVEGIKTLKKHLGSAPEHWLLSLLNEQLVSYPSVETITLERFNCAYDRVKDLLSPEAQKKIQEVISNDCRLKCSKDLISVEISSDGWVEKDFHIQIKNLTPCNYLILNCSNEIPCPSENKIDIFIGKKKVLTQKIQKNGFFQIKLPLMRCHHDLVHFDVRCNNFFIPDIYPESRGDFRKLSFKISDFYKKPMTLSEKLFFIDILPKEKQFSV